VDAVTGLRAGLDELESVLAQAHGIADLENRLARISEHFLGRPYLSGPLRGSPTEQERLVSRLDGFDCVTFAESVIALGRSGAPVDFERELIALRYRHGQVGWLERNHYMSLWIERNAEAGAVCPVLRESWIGEGAARTLCCLEGFPALERRLEYLPVGRAEELSQEARSGDVICFVSTRGDLDTYHVGLLVRRGAPLPPLLRHASRSAGRVVEESLTDFLQRNETPGFLVARPLSPDAGDDH
jgi:hypothetical protein